MHKRVLVVTAQSGELEKGIGGALTRLDLAGFSMYSVVTTLPADPAQREIRRAESMKSHALLGAQPIFWGEPDGALEVNVRLRTLMQSVYDNIHPDIVLTLWPADVHPDHRATADIAMGPALQRGVNTELLCFEVCASGRIAAEFRPQSLGFFPTHYVDTTKVQHEKRALMNCHQSQDPDGMWAGMRNMHANRGSEGVDAIPYDETVFAEGFVRLTRCGQMSQHLEALFSPTPYLFPEGIGVDFNPKTIGITL